MSKINKSVPSDDSSNKTLPKSVIAKPPIKDLPKLEVVKVIAPKPLETNAVEEKNPLPTSNQEPVKAPKKAIAASLKTAPKSYLSSTNNTVEFQADLLPSKASVNQVSVNQALVNSVNTVESEVLVNQEDKSCLQPIPLATEPFQYRAIGVILGRYVPHEDNFSKGYILAVDGSRVDAVLLGKIISIVKKRLQSDRDYLWVVYPRTNDKAGKLHVQIAGVWAPVELGKSSVEIEPNVQDGYFSVRGEISSQSLEDNTVIVKVRRTEQKFDKQKDKLTKEYSKFKVRLTGLLPTDAVGQFWSVNVQRQGDILTIIDGEFIGIIPYNGKRHQQPKNRYGGKFAPKKNSDRPYSDRPYSDRPFKPTRSGDGASITYPPRPKSSERPPVPKPLIKRKNPIDS